jgi:hypothetical protein
MLFGLLVRKKSETTGTAVRPVSLAGFGRDFRLKSAGTVGVATTNNDAGKSRILFDWTVPVPAFRTTIGLVADGAELRLFVTVTLVAGEPIFTP